MGNPRWRRERQRLQPAEGFLQVQQLSYLLLSPGPQKDGDRQKARRELLLHQLVQDTSPAEDLSVFRGRVVSSVTSHGGEVLQFSSWISLTPSPHAPYRFGVAFSYYGMSMNLTGFGLNMYLSQFVFGVIEVPAKMIMYVLVNRVGRRQSQAWSLILTGLCIGANIIIPKRKTSFQFLLKGRDPFCAALENENHRTCSQANSV